MSGDGPQYMSQSRLRGTGAVGRSGRPLHSRTLKPPRLTWTAWQSRSTHGCIDPDDVIEAVRLNTQGRVGLVNGDAQEILPVITCYTGGRHTHASQFVGVNTKAGIVILASDNMYLYENLEKHVPIAATLDAASNLRAQDRMKQLAANPRLIIPGHDPAVMTNFPNPTPGVAKIQ